MKKAVLFVLLAALILSAALIAPSLRVKPPADPQPWTYPPVVEEHIPAPAPDPEPLPEPPSIDPVQELLDSLSLEEKVGQLFLVRRPAEGSAEDAAKYHLGGFVLFYPDVEGKTAEEVRAMICADQTAKLPLLIATDEEGGTVCRVSANPKLRPARFASPRSLLETGGLDALTADATEKAQLLLSLGINVNLAPVCDLSSDPGDFIYKRSPAGEAQTAADAVAAQVQAFSAEGLGCVLKHFPGYGGNADTHVGFAYDARPMEQFEQADFPPFLAGMEAGAGAVMVSHNIVQAMDAQRPASLSPEVHRILREELNFDGVIMTDDLYMDAIRDLCGEEEAAVQAILAGNDLLCCTDYRTQLPAVLAAVQDGTIPEAMIDAACYRVLKWKLDLGLIK